MTRALSAACWLVVLTVGGLAVAVLLGAAEMPLAD